MPDPFGNPMFSEVLSNTVQSLIQTRQQQVQNLQAMAEFDLRRRAQEDVMSAREERLKMQEQTTQLAAERLQLAQEAQRFKEQMAEAKTATAESPFADAGKLVSMQTFVRNQIEESASAVELPPELSRWQSARDEEIRRGIAEAEDKKVTLARDPQTVYTANQFSTYQSLQADPDRNKAAAWLKAHDNIVPVNPYAAIDSVVQSAHAALAFRAKARDEALRRHPQASILLDPQARALPSLREQEGLDTQIRDLLPRTNERGQLAVSKLDDTNRKSLVDLLRKYQGSPDAYRQVVAAIKARGLNASDIKALVEESFSGAR